MGIVNIVVWFKIFECYWKIVMSGCLIFVKGYFQWEEGVIYVVVGYIIDYMDWLFDYMGEEDEFMFYEIQILYQMMY